MPKICAILWLMPITITYIIDIEILDKRQVRLASTNMERKAVKRGLERLTQDIKVVEFVTDASTSVKALLGMYNTHRTLTS